MPGELLPRSSTHAARRPWLGGHRCPRLWRADIMFVCRVARRSAPRGLLPSRATRPACHLTWFVAFSSDQPTYIVAVRQCGHRGWRRGFGGRASARCASPRAGADRRPRRLFAFVVVAQGPQASVLRAAAMGLVAVLAL